MMIRPIALALSVALTGVSPGAALAADETAEERDTRLKKAQAYLDLATTLFRDKDFAGALTELRRADPLLDGSEIQPLVRFNIARCLEELGRAPEAVRAYQRYLSTSDPSDRRIERAREAINALEPQAVGQLSIACAQPDTVLRVEGLEQPNQSCPLSVPRLLGGDYLATASASGFMPSTHTIRVQPGQTASHRFDLLPEPQKAPMKVDAKPVRDDGRSVITWLVLGVGAGAAATGGAFHALALQSQDDADTAGSPSEYDTAVSAYEAQRTGAITAYTVGGALIGLGVYLLVRDSGGGLDASVHPTPDGVFVRF